MYAMTGVAVGGIAVGLAGSPASAASAVVRFCPRGTSVGFVHILPVAGYGHTQSRVLLKGNCWATQMDTRNQVAQIDVVALRPDGGERWMGAVYWSSSKGSINIVIGGTPEFPNFGIEH
ncbi:hypothetical protein [Actinoplanes sp. NPDC048796]|uniref:hypothetical protein n=2 Tax=unclassified Actinoplanes TaxID=2626549 RepID=UPI0033C1A4F0